MWYVDTYDREATRWGPFKTYADALAFSKAFDKSHIYEEST